MRLPISIISDVLAPLPLYGYRRAAPPRLRGTWTAPDLTPTDMIALDEILSRAEPWLGPIEGVASAGQFNADLAVARYGNDWAKRDGKRIKRDGTFKADESGRSKGSDPDERLDYLPHWGD